MLDSITEEPHLYDMIKLRMLS